MDKFSSKLGENIFLSEEDFTELKLCGASWIIYVPSSTSTSQHVLNLMYKHTNLLTINDVDHNLITVSPKTQIKIYWDDTGQARTLYTDGSYYFWPAEDK